MTTEEQKELLDLHRKVKELEGMRETAKLVSITQDENQKMFTRLLRMKEQQYMAFSLIMDLHILERDKETYNQLKNILKP